MVQTVIVYLIGIAIVVWLVWKLYRIFSRKEYSRLCGGCPLAEECSKVRRKCPDRPGGDCGCG